MSLEKFFKNLSDEQAVRLSGIVNEYKKIYKEDNRLIHSFYEVEGAAEYKKNATSKLVEKIVSADLLNRSDAEQFLSAVENGLGRLEDEKRAAKQRRNEGTMEKWER